ncbi:hypothetical protein Aduo_004087 [Ancylostoma duodenale]
MTTLAVLSEMIVERRFAYFYVVDYEKNPRLWISTGILLLSRMLTLIFNFTIMIRCYPFICVIGGSGILVTILVLLLAIMYRSNRVRLLELRSGVINARTVNTLSVKFQLIENERVLKLVMVAFCLAAVLIILGLLLLLLSFLIYDQDPRKGQVCFALLDLLVALSTCGGFFAFLLILSESRRILRKFFVVRMLFPKLARGPLFAWQKKRIDNHRGASDQYFDQLKQAWE